jgi:hypothetical protein
MLHVFVYLFSAVAPRIEGNTLVVGLHEFRVLPDAEVEEGYQDHNWKPVAVPTGWEIASRADADMDVVAEQVIAPYGWSTHLLAVRRGEASEGFSTFRTKNANGSPGTVNNENNGHVTALPGGKYKITHTTIRLLIRRQARRARGGPCALAARSRPCARCHSFPTSLTACTLDARKAGGRHGAHAAV